MPEPIPFPQPQLTRTPPIGMSGLASAAMPVDQIDKLITVEDGADGSIDIVVADKPPSEDAVTSGTFDENLADRDELQSSLGTIATELLEGIAADERSRDAWVQNYNEGLDLLGLKITKSTQVSTETMSSVTHPILLEACLRFRALARGEILPASGPAKVRNDGDESDERQQLADQLEEDLNHWLTVTASEYYPDTDRGLMYVAFGGDIFKKVYYDPVRKRPSSECVYLPDLIVSQDITDLDNASRVTHKIEMSKTQVRRLVEAGWYVDAALSEPVVNPSAIDRKEKEIVGIAPVPQRQEDYQRTILECYTELELPITEKGAPKGLPLPYRVTLDKDSSKVLEIRRNWRPTDKDFRKRQRFVKWPFMPGMGFYDLGYLHILGQHAKALTAILRISIDAGMLGNFPGGVKLKGARTDTNQIRPSPGEFVELDGGAGVARIQDVLMPMPYKDLSPVLLQLMQALEDDARKLAGTVDLEAGEGRTNVPVGTIMATIEQQTQMMTAVHKGLHAAQQQEFILLRELFAEDPEALWRDNPQARQWKAEELTDMSFVPASDPNTPAQIHRIMQSWALQQISQNNPLYNQYKVQVRLLNTLRISDPEELLIDPKTIQPQQNQAAAPAGLPPQALAAIAQGELQTEQGKVAATNTKNLLDHKAKMADIQRQWNEHLTEMQKDQSNATLDRESQERIAAFNGRIQLLLKGIEQIGQPVSPEPLPTNTAGP